MYKVNRNSLFSYFTESVKDKCLIKFFSKDKNDKYVYSKSFKHDFDEYIQQITNCKICKSSIDNQEYYIGIILINRIG